MELFKKRTGKLGSFVPHYCYINVTKQSAAFLLGRSIMTLYKHILCISVCVNVSVYTLVWILYVQTRKSYDLVRT